EQDLLRDVIAERGKVLFHGIRIKPGKPTLFGMVDGRPIYGMPGLPAACLMSSHVILAPCARLLARLPPRQERIETLPVGGELRTPSSRPMMPVRTEGGPVYQAFRESGAIGAMSSAEGYVRMEEYEIGRGSIVEVRFFQ
ncbi:MAG: hypothetical protein LUO79_06870, partial [Methanomassiliicoccales archaeon]|nr:hypothetical protein [Methanomassiliicoccales archaeon]